jgi:hypothetical protein
MNKPLIVEKTQTYLAHAKRENDAILTENQVRRLLPRRYRDAILVLLTRAMNRFLERSWHVRPIQLIVNEQNTTSKVCHVGASTQQPLAKRLLFPSHPGAIRQPAGAA